MAISGTFLRDTGILSGLSRAAGNGRSRRGADRDRVGKGRRFAVSPSGTVSPLGLTSPRTKVDRGWKTPGPVAGPGEAKRGDGSIVTYFVTCLLTTDFTDHGPRPRFRAE